jgi:hypothetical protein
MTAGAPARRAPGLSMTLVVAGREIRDQLRDWRILAPILILTLFFPVLMNFTAAQAVAFVGRYGAPIVGERLVPFLLMVVGFFPISISLVIALESFAGERERLSLEPLLATPLTNAELYLGKMIASAVTPLAAAYVGIGVYLVGLWFQIGWSAPFPLLAQVILLTTAQAVVMVSGAVVISSQTTSVRAANLLASFIIVPVSQLIIAESLIMFWGRYTALWGIVVGLSVIAVLLARMGLHLFSRENLLGREIDLLNLRWVRRVLVEGFVAGARSPLDWYRGVLQCTLPALAQPIVVVSVLLALAAVLGADQMRAFPLPKELLQFHGLDASLEPQLRQLGLLSGAGALWVWSNNLRSLAFATFLGAFTFGVVGVVLLMVPVALVGYFAANAAAAGGNAFLLVAGLVLPHGLFEVPGAILAGAAILRVGMSLVVPARGRSLGESWLLAWADWARVGFGLVVPLMALAALVETFVTPRVALLLLGGR